MAVSQIVKEAWRTNESRETVFTSAHHPFQKGNT